MNIKTHSTEYYYFKGYGHIGILITKKMLYFYFSLKLVDYIFLNNLFLNFSIDLKINYWEISGQQILIKYVYKKKSCQTILNFLFF